MIMGDYKYTESSIGYIMGIIDCWYSEYVMCLELGDMDNEKINKSFINLNFISPFLRTISIFPKALKDFLI